MPPVVRFRDLQVPDRRELWATLALRHCPGLGVRSCKILVENFGSAYAALAAKESWVNFGIKKQAVQTAIAESWREAAKAEWDALGRCNPRILLWRHASYPAYLRELSDAPLLLYGEGDFSLLASPCIAIIGSRNASEHGQKVASHMARNLASCGICVVAGMARGIDGIAHRAAVDEVGRSIGILGNGIDICYPVSHAPLFDTMKARGLLLTEFAPGCKPLPQNFPIRNRLISGISLGVVVVEAAEKSGSLITAKAALEQNREVYAVPGPAMDEHYSGCHRLVRDGARAVFTIEDLLCDLAPRLQTYGMDISALPCSLPKDRPEKVATPLPGTSLDQERQGEVIPIKDSVAPIVPDSPHLLKPEWQQIVSFLQRHGMCHIDRLADALDEPVTSLNAVLMELELAGQVKRLPGAHYEKVRN